MKYLYKQYKIIGTNAYANLSGHCPHRKGIKSLGEKISSNEDKIAGKNPNNELITKYDVTIMNDAIIVFKRKTGTILSPPMTSTIPRAVWKGGGYHKAWGLNKLSVPYLRSM